LRAAVIRFFSRHHDEAAAEEAWQRTLDWFNKYLKA
jgi:dienelactone hydrolase